MFNGYNQPLYESDPGRDSAKKTGQVPGPGWSYGQTFYNPEPPQQLSTSAWQPKPSYQGVGPSRKCSCLQCQGSWYHKEQPELSTGPNPDLMVLGPPTAVTTPPDYPGEYSRLDPYLRSTVQPAKPHPQVPYPTSGQTYGPPRSTVKQTNAPEFSGYERGADPFMRSYEPPGFVRKPPDQRAKYWETVNGSLYPPPQQYQYPPASCRYPPYNAPYYPYSGAAGGTPPQQYHFPQSQPPSFQHSSQQHQQMPQHHSQPQLQQQQHAPSQQYYGIVPNPMRQMQPAYYKQDNSKVSPLRLMRKKKSDSIEQLSPPRMAQSSDAAPLDVRRFLATWDDEDDDCPPTPQMVVLDCQNINEEEAELLRAYEQSANTIRLIQEQVVTERVPAEITQPTQFTELIERVNCTEEPVGEPPPPTQPILPAPVHVPVVVCQEAPLVSQTPEDKNDPPSVDENRDEVGRLSVPSPDSPTSRDSLPVLADLPTSEYRKNKFLDYDSKSFPQLPSRKSIDEPAAVIPSRPESAPVLGTPSLAEEKKVGKKRGRKPTIKFSIQKSHDLKISLRVLNDKTGEPVSECPRPESVPATEHVVSNDLFTLRVEDDDDVDVEDPRAKRARKIRKRRVLEDSYSISSEERNNDVTSPGFQVQESADLAKIKLTFKRRKCDADPDVPVIKRKRGRPPKVRPADGAAVVTKDCKRKSQDEPPVADTTTDHNGHPPHKNPTDLTSHREYPSPQPSCTKSPRSNDTPRHSGSSSPKITSSCHITSPRTSTDSIERELQAIWNGDGKELPKLCTEKVENISRDLKSFDNDSESAFSLPFDSGDKGQVSSNDNVVDFYTEDISTGPLLNISNQKEAPPRASSTRETRISTDSVKSNANTPRDELTTPSDIETAHSVAFPRPGVIFHGLNFTDEFEPACNKPLDLTGAYNPVDTEDVSFRKIDFAKENINNCHQELNNESYLVDNQQSNAVDIEKTAVSSSLPGQNNAPFCETPPNTDQSNATEREPDPSANTSDKSPSVFDSPNAHDDLLSPCGSLKKPLRRGPHTPDEPYHSQESDFDVSYSCSSEEPSPVHHTYMRNGINTASPDYPYTFNRPEVDSIPCSISTSEADLETLAIRPKTPEGGLTPALPESLQTENNSVLNQSPLEFMTLSPTGRQHTEPVLEKIEGDPIKSQRRRSSVDDCCERIEAELLSSIVDDVETRRIDECEHFEVKKPELDVPSSAPQESSHPPCQRDIEEVSDTIPKLSPTPEITSSLTENIGEVDAPVSLSEDHGEVTQKIPPTDGSPKVYPCESPLEKSLSCEQLQDLGNELPPAQEKAPDNFEHSSEQACEPSLGEDIVSSVISEPNLLLETNTMSPIIPIALESNVTPDIATQEASISSILDVLEESDETNKPHIDYAGEQKPPDVELITTELSKRINQKWKDRSAARHRKESAPDPVHPVCEKKSGDCIDLSRIRKLSEKIRGQPLPEAFPPHTSNTADAIATKAISSSSSNYKNKSSKTRQEVKVHHRDKLPKSHAKKETKQKYRKKGEKRRKSVEVKTICEPPTNDSQATPAQSVTEPIFQVSEIFEDKDDVKSSPKTLQADCDLLQTTCASVIQGQNDVLVLPKINDIGVDSINNEFDPKTSLTERGNCSVINENKVAQEILRNAIEKADEKTETCILEEVTDSDEQKAISLPDGRDESSEPLLDSELGESHCETENLPEPTCEQGNVGKLKEVNQADLLEDDLEQVSDENDNIIVISEDVQEVVLEEQPIVVDEKEETSQNEIEDGEIVEDKEEYIVVDGEGDESYIVEGMLVEIGEDGDDSIAHIPLPPGSPPIENRFAPEHDDTMDVGAIDPCPNLLTERSKSPFTTDILDLFRNPSPPSTPRISSPCPMAVNPENPAFANFRRPSLDFCDIEMNEVVGEALPDDAGFQDVMENCLANARKFLSGNSPPERKLAAISTGFEVDTDGEPDVPEDTGNFTSPCIDISAEKLSGAVDYQENELNAPVSKVTGESGQSTPASLAKMQIENVLKEREGTLKSVYKEKSEDDANRLDDPGDVLASFDKNLAEKAANNSGLTVDNEEDKPTSTEETTRTLDVLLSSFEGTSDIEATNSAEVSLNVSPFHATLGSEVLPVDNWPYLEEEVPMSPQWQSKDEDVPISEPAFSVISPQPTSVLPKLSIPQKSSSKEAMERKTPRLRRRTFDSIPSKRERKVTFSSEREGTDCETEGSVKKSPLKSFKCRLSLKRLSSTDEESVLTIINRIAPKEDVDVLPADKSRDGLKWQPKVVLSRLSESVMKKASDKEKGENTPELKKVSTVCGKDNIRTPYKTRESSVQIECKKETSKTSIKVKSHPSGTETSRAKSSKADLSQNTKVKIVEKFLDAKPARVRIEHTPKIKKEIASVNKMEENAKPRSSSSKSVQNDKKLHLEKSITSKPRSSSIITTKGKCEVPQNQKTSSSASVDAKSSKSRKPSKCTSVVPPKATAPEQNRPLVPKTHSTPSPEKRPKLKRDTPKSTNVKSPNGSSCSKTAQVIERRRSSVHQSGANSSDDSPSEDAGPWVCRVCGFNNVEDQQKHIQEHSFHCQSCHLAFKSEGQFIRHLTRRHKEIRKMHHCLMCEVSFDTDASYYSHMESREHRHLEAVEKNTIHTLFTLLSGQPCPVLGPVEQRPEWLPSQAGTVHFYHQATPLSLAMQYWKMRQGSAVTK